MAKSVIIKNSPSPLPQCTDNERVVVASLLYFPKMVAETVHRLYPQMIYDGKCAIAYRAMIRMLIRRVPVDIVSVAQECKTIADSDYRNTDWDIWLMDLVDKTATTKNVDYHIQRIREADMRRRVIKLSQAAYEDAEDIEATIRQIGQIAGESGATRSRIVGVEDFWGDVENLYSKGVKPGLDTGWNGLNEFYRPAPGYINIVSGLPSSGKSEWLDALVLNMLRLHGFRVAYYSPENRPWEFHAQKLVEKLVGAPFFGEGILEQHELGKAKEWLTDRVYWLQPDRKSRTVAELLRLSEAAVNEFGVKIIVLDPWNQIDHSVGYNIREDRYISDKLSEIGDFIKETGTIFYLVAHTTKLQKDQKSKKFPVPSLYDISGGAQWFNKADFGIVIHREGDDVQVHIQKVRFKNHGKKGVQAFSYDSRSGRYREIETGFEEPQETDRRAWWDI